jgi:hypothetical protein
MKAFASVYGCDFNADNKDFFNFFRDKGCYLDDISHKPVDSLSPAERRKCVNQCIPSFVQRLKEFEPGHMIIVLKRIERDVNQAIQKSNLQLKPYAVPFPGNGHQKKFIDELSNILKKIMSRKY